MTSTPPPDKNGEARGTGLSVELHGSSVTAQDALDAGQATTRLLDAAAELIGAPTGWTVTGSYFKCDGCGLRLPDRPEADAGWTFRDGDDFCPDCSAGVPSS